jgi:hypothetical protein
VWPSSKTTSTENGRTDELTWPTDLTPDRYPGTIRREIIVESTVQDGGRLLFTAVLCDRWRDEAGNEEEIHGYDVQPRFLPFPDCPAAAAAAQRLVGTRLTKGFRPAATAALGSVEGCTHLLTLVLAIWNQQVVTTYMVTRVDAGNSERTMLSDQIAGTCSGWREGGVGLRLLRNQQPFPRSVDYGGT